jgi:hypothetical protein
MKATVQEAQLRPNVSTASWPELLLMHMLVQVRRYQVYAVAVAEQW